jgi:hypothetical protein
MSSSKDMEKLSSWFENAGGNIDSSVMGFADFPADGGRGAVALQDIEVRTHPALTVKSSS